ncbi:hypothetical protein [Demequina sp.]|uniref:hypothetical protein n=1 Tax=Demequina sp. TaxID=2050685 RepID=UPI0025F7DECF|nr:hypothetical protein [Demequina sp.]
MSDVESAAVGTVPAATGTRAAWLATAIGIPVYGALALLMSYISAPLVDMLAPDRNTVEDLGIFLGVAVVNVSIALVGIMIIAHTAGRLLFARTLTRPTRSAAIAFAVMGSTLAVIPVVFVAFAQPLHLVGTLYAALAIGVPCGVTSGFTRAVLPAVAASRSATRTAAAVGIGGVVVVILWSAVVLFGVGR